MGTLTLALVPPVRVQPVLETYPLACSPILLPSTHGLSLPTLISVVGSVWCANLTHARLPSSSKQGTHSTSISCCVIGSIILAIFAASSLLRRPHCHPDSAHNRLLQTEIGTIEIVNPDSFGIV